MCGIQMNPVFIVQYSDGYCTLKDLPKMIFDSFSRGETATKVPLPAMTENLKIISRKKNYSLYFLNGRCIKGQLHLHFSLKASKISVIEQ